MENDLALETNQTHPGSPEQIVRQHAAQVYRLAYRLTGNRQDAEDLAQEVFYRVFRSLANYKDGTFEGWLHRITTNLFLDSVRKKSRVKFDNSPEPFVKLSTTNELDDPVRSFEHNSLDKDIQAALLQLKPEYRAVIALCDMEGLSYEEIAVTLGVRPGTVRSRIHRGRAKLRELLEHRAPQNLTRVNDVGVGE